MKTMTTTTNTKNASKTTSAIRRGGLNLNWYDLTVAGLVIISGIGGMVRILGA